MAPSATAESAQWKVGRAGWIQLWAVDVQGTRYTARVEGGRGRTAT